MAKDINSMSLEELDQLAREFASSSAPIHEPLTGGPMRRFMRGAGRGATLGLMGQEPGEGDIAGKIGEFVGGAVPAGAAMMVAGPIAAPLARAASFGPLGAELLREGVGGALFGGGEAAARGEDVVKETVRGAATFPLLGLAGKGIRAGYRYLKGDVIPASLRSTPIEPPAMTPPPGQMDLGITPPEPVQMGLPGIEVPLAGPPAEPTGFRGVGGRMRSLKKEPAPYAVARDITGARVGRSQVEESGHFVEHGYDPLTGIRYIRPVTIEGEHAIDRAAQQGLPIHNEQLSLPIDKEHFLEWEVPRMGPFRPEVPVAGLDISPEAVGARKAGAELRDPSKIKAFLSVGDKREMNKISSTLKQPEGVIAQTINSEASTTKLVDMAEIGLTKEGQRVRNLIENSSIPQHELEQKINEIMTSAPSGVRQAMILQYLQSRCG